MEKTRRSFLKKTLAASLALTACGLEEHQTYGRKKLHAGVGNTLGACTINTRNDDQMDIFSTDITQPVKLILIADTHLWMSDGREDPYRQYSGRMTKAYNKTKHFRTLAPTHPCEQFEKTMDMVRDARPDALFLLGDIVSYPSEAAIEWAKEQLDRTGVNYYYISGNHDWHYEGMAGTEIDLRAEWTQKRLAPLYRGHNPLVYNVNIKGVNIIMLDNSTYEILPEQLDFFRREVRRNRPTLLMSHCPLYAPGFPLSYGCGHPEWNASTDRNYKIERRPQWPAEGHKPETYDFWNETIEASQKHHLLATFAGHVHRQSSSAVNGWKQYTLKPNYSGAYLEVHLNPMPQKKS